MAIRIVGVDLPQNKRGEIALTYIYGIGRSSSAKILDKAGVNRDLKVSEWSDDQAAKIREIIGAEFKVEGDLRSERSEEHTSELQSRFDLVCRLLLEKKKYKKQNKQQGVNFNSRHNNDE